MEVENPYDDEARKVSDSDQGVDAGQQEVVNDENPYETQEFKLHSPKP